MEFLFQNMLEKNNKIGKNSIPIFFSLQMKVKKHFHSILFLNHIKLYFK
jgi:hypothetical protein